LRHLPLLILVPLIPCAGLVVLLVYWVLVTSWVASAGVEPATEAIDSAVQVASKYFGNSTIAAFQTSTATHAQIRDNGIAVMLGYHTFGFLWTAMFLKGVTQLTISGTVIDFYFLRDRSLVTSRSIPAAAWRAVRFHLGSVAFGSLLVSMVVVVRALFEYIHRKSKDLQEKNCAVKIIMCATRCCLWCFHKCVRYISTAAYITMAMKGEAFCPSCMYSFVIILNNMKRIGTVHVITNFVLHFGKILVVLAAVFVMFLIVRNPPESGLDVLGVEVADANLVQISNPILPLIVTFMFSYLTATYCFAVLRMTMETILFCFCEDLRTNHSDNFASPSLRRYIDVEAPHFAFRQFSHRRGRFGLGWHQRTHEEEHDINYSENKNLAAKAKEMGFLKDPPSVDVMEGQGNPLFGHEKSMRKISRPNSKV